MAFFFFLQLFSKSFSAKLLFQETKCSVPQKKSNPLSFKEHQPEILIGEMSNVETIEKRYGKLVLISAMISC